MKGKITKTLSLYDKNSKINKNEFKYPRSCTTVMLNKGNKNIENINIDI